MLVSGNCKGMRLKRMDELKEWVGMGGEEYKEKEGKEGMEKIEGRVMKGGEKGVEKCCG